MNKLLVPKSTKANKQWTKFHEIRIFTVHTNNNPNKLFITKLFSRKTPKMKLLNTKNCYYRSQFRHYWDEFLNMALIYCSQLLKNIVISDYIYHFWLVVDEFFQIFQIHLIHFYFCLLPAKESYACANTRIETDHEIYGWKIKGANYFSMFM